MNDRVWTKYLSVVLMVAMGTIPLQPLLATPSRVQIQTPRRSSPLKYIPRTLGGLPVRRVPSASRSPVCTPRNQPITALVPAKEPQRTTTATPTLFVYVPPSKAKTFEFVVQDQQRKIYRKTFAAAEKPGIVRLTVPADSGLAPLQVGQSYRWVFKLVCNHQNRGEDQVIDGMIERVQPDAALTQALAKADAKKRVDLYAAAGIWQDTFTNLVDLRATQPHNRAIQTDWEDLLKSIELENITKAPIVPCCTMQAGQ